MSTEVLHRARVCVDIVAMLLWTVEVVTNGVTRRHLMLCMSLARRPHGGSAQMLLVLVASFRTCWAAGTSKILADRSGLS